MSRYQCCSPVPLLRAGHHIGWTHWQVSHNIRPQHLSLATKLSVQTLDPGQGTQQCQVLLTLAPMILCSTSQVTGHHWTPVTLLLVTRTLSQVEAEDAVSEASRTFV